MVVVKKNLDLRRVHRDRRGGGRPGERGRPTSGSGSRVGEAWGANAGGSPGKGEFGMGFGVMGVEGALGQSGRASRDVSGFPRSPGVKLMLG